MGRRQGQRDGEAHVGRSGSRPTSPSEFQPQWTRAAWPSCQSLLFPGRAPRPRVSRQAGPDPHPSGLCLEACRGLRARGRSCRGGDMPREAGPGCSRCLVPAPPPGTQGPAGGWGTSRLLLPPGLTWLLLASLQSLHLPGTDPALRAGPEGSSKSSPAHGAGIHPSPFMGSPSCERPLCLQILRPSPASGSEMLGMCCWTSDR